MKAFILIIIQLFSYSIIQLFAQPAHEFSIYGGGGLSTFRYQLSSGDASGGYGGDFGVGYTCFVNDQWGIQTGAGLGLYSAKAKIDDLKTVTPNLADSEGNRFDLHTTIAGYNETQKAMFLNIPVMVQFQTQQQQGFYVMGGIKVGIPLSGKYASKNATFTNSGFYPDLKNWATTQEFAGYGTFKGQNNDGNLDLGVSFLLALEAGMKWRIGNNLSLYTGAYFDYGLNNVAPRNNLPFINYTADHPSDFTANSVLSTFADKINMMTVGVKVRLETCRKTSNARPSKARR